ncbi:thioredoxin family protein [Rhodopirellula sp.]|nr:thioredoxin family protein [Rhodopirellula sp.]
MSRTARPYRITFLIGLMALQAAMSLNGIAQTRDELVREDRRKITDEGFWIYNDLPKAFATAKQTGKPILVVLRCIPCHECVKLDDDLVDKDPTIRPLLNQFVCVRQVSTNGLDLELFQYDTDQSFAVFILNADGTVYGRFGTRSHRTDWLGDVSLDGLAEALKGSLTLHRNYPRNRAQVVGKRGGKPEVASPEKYPSLKDKFTNQLNYSGDVSKSCIHCHQIGDAQRSFYWNSGKPIPENILFPYPHPKILGLILDPKKKATIESVLPESIAANSGLRTGDIIELIAGQSPLSIADVQWVLHQAPATGGNIPLSVKRNNQLIVVSLKLPPAWRQLGDLSWRATSWAYRRMLTGGMRLTELVSEKRKQLNLDENQMALQVQHLGQYNAHAAAKRAGLRKGDILIGYDGRTDLKTESQLFTHSINRHKPGDKVPVTALREGKKREFTIPIQP